MATAQRAEVRSRQRACQERWGGRASFNTVHLTILTDLEKLIQRVRRRWRGRKG